MTRSPSFLAGNGRPTAPTSNPVRADVIDALRDVVIDASSREHSVVSVPTATLARLLDELLRLRAHARQR